MHIHDMYIQMHRHELTDPPPLQPITLLIITLFIYTEGKALEIGDSVVLIKNSAQHKNSSVFLDIGKELTPIVLYISTVLQAWDSFYSGNSMQLSI